MASKEIQEATMKVADLHILLGRHRMEREHDQRWKRKERDLVQKLASAYAKLAGLKAARRP